MRRPKEVNDAWIAHKEPSEFIDQVTICIYKEGAAPPEVLEEVNQGETAHGGSWTAAGLARRTASTGPAGRRTQQAIGGKWMRTEIWMTRRMRRNLPG